jgi:hypothetical protein
VVKLVGGRRALTPDVRRRLGLRSADERPYRWEFAALVVGLACAPLLFAGYRALPLGVAVVGLGLLPALRWLEARELRVRDRIYTDGHEAFGQVLAVEPGSDANKDRTIHLQFWAEGKKVEAKVVGCRLARQGLGPDDDVRVLFDPAEPKRCLVIEKVRRGVVDAV